MESERERKNDEPFSHEDSALDSAHVKIPGRQLSGFGRGAQDADLPETIVS